MTDHSKAPQTEPLINVTSLNEALEKFASDRDWAQFHSTKNLVMAITGEVGELSKISQWMTETQSRTAGINPDNAQAVKEELAGVQLYLVRLASVLGIDLNEAVQDKLQKTPKSPLPTR